MHLKIYLDACVYNRPFDDQKQPRIAIEAMEVLVLLSKIESGAIKLIGSFALEYENDKNPYTERRDMVADMLSLAQGCVGYSDGVINRAKKIQNAGIMAMDAIHLACAEEAKVDYFITCDNVLLKKALRIKEQLKVRVVSLLSFMSEEVLAI